jgi:5-methylcytosine-specific restriction enzyme A
MPRKAQPHTTPRGDNRPPNHNAYYKTARWIALSRHIRRTRPLCEDCKRAPSQQVDHRIPRSRGGTDDPSNLRAVCLECHGRKTATTDGGFGNPPSSL